VRRAVLQEHRRGEINGAATIIIGIQQVLLMLQAQRVR
jgi:hypothetical protein